MSIVSNLELFLTQGLHILNWRDFIEIVCFSTIVYTFLRWLKQDKQKNLVIVFYGYAAFAVCAYFGNFLTLNYLLMSYLPIAIVIFIILHQELLQKNFVTLQRLKTDDITDNWFDEFTRACLSALNTNKEIICVIERNDSLKNLITTQFVFHADFKKDIFDIVLEKQVHSSQYFMWLNQEGKIVAINARWNLQLDEQWVTPEAQSIHKWKQDGIFISSKTDALIFKITPLTRTFDVIFGGKLREEISANQAFTILQRQLHNNAPLNTQEHVNQKSKQQQKTV